VPRRAVRDPCASCCERPVEHETARPQPDRPRRGRGAYRWFARRPRAPGSLGEHRHRPERSLKATKSGPP
jgi:hypothetical protein